MVTVVQGKVSAKNHPDRLSRLATIHQRYRQTDRQTDFLWHRSAKNCLVQCNYRDKQFWKLLNFFATVLIKLLCCSCNVFYSCLHMLKQNTLAYTYASFIKYNTYPTYPRALTIVLVFIYSFIVSCIQNKSNWIYKIFFLFVCVS